tara:strand:+ start:16337 stop:16639 length:303 start_codon:yes stop_codon:yes gene_type:complete
VEKCGKRCYPIKRVNAVDAAKTSIADIIFVSWPPYECDAVVEAARAWGAQRKIIYIGELQCGCNAPDEFFENYKYRIMNLGFVSFEGIHDNVCIGNCMNE